MNTSTARFTIDMGRGADESKPEHLQRMLARALPGLYEEIKATTYFLTHLPESIRPQAVERAAALQARAEFIRKLMEDKDGRRNEGREAGAVRPKVRSYVEYEYPERKESPFEEVTGGSGRRDGGSGD